MGCCQTSKTHWEPTLVKELSCNEESVIKAKEVQLLYSTFHPLVGVTSLSSVQSKLAGTDCQSLRSRFSMYFHTAELQSKLVLAFLLISEMPHCQKVHMLLQLLNSDTICVTDFEELVDSLTELAGRVLPFASIPLGKAYELHHYIASLTKAKATFRKQCLQELKNKATSTTELRHKLLSSPLLKALVSSTALRRKLWTIYNRSLEVPGHMQFLQPRSLRNSCISENLRQRVSFDDCYRHSSDEASRLAYSEVSTIFSE